MMYDFELRVFEGTPEEFEACVRILDSRHPCSCAGTTPVHAPAPTTEVVAPAIPPVGVTPTVAPGAFMTKAPGQSPRKAPKDNATLCREKRARRKARKLAALAASDPSVKPSSDPETCALGSRDPIPTQSFGSRDPLCDQKGGGGDFSISSESLEKSHTISPISPSFLSSEEDLKGQDRATPDPRPPTHDARPTTPVIMTGVAADPRSRGVERNSWNEHKLGWCEHYIRVVERHAGVKIVIVGYDVGALETLLRTYCTGTNADPFKVPAWLESVLIPFIAEQASNDLRFRGYTPKKLLERMGKGPLVIATNDGEPHVSPDEERRRRFNRAEKLQYRLEAEGAQPTPSQKAILDEFRLEVRPKMTDADRAAVVATCTRLKLPIPPGFEGASSDPPSEPAKATPEPPVREPEAEVVWSEEELAGLAKARDAAERARRGGRSESAAE